MHFSCRTDTGTTDYEEFVRADVRPRSVMAWQTTTARQPVPAPPQRTNVHVVAAPDEADFARTSSSRTSPSRRHEPVTASSRTVRRVEALLLADLEVVLDTRMSVRFARPMTAVPLTDKAQATRDALVRSAGELFEASGYGAVSVRDLARQERRDQRRDLRTFSQQGRPPRRRDRRSHRDRPRRSEVRHGWAHRLPRSPVARVPVAPGPARAAHRRRACGPRRRRGARQDRRAVRGKARRVARDLPVVARRRRCRSPRSTWTPSSPCSSRWSSASVSWRRPMSSSRSRVRGRQRCASFSKELSNRLSRARRATRHRRASQTVAGRCRQIVRQSSNRSTSCSRSATSS